MRKHRHINNNQSGLASIEFAAILPIMLMLLFVTAELGRALYEFNTLTKMVRNGARYAADFALNGVQNASLSHELNTKVKNLVVNGTLTGVDLPLLSGLSIENVNVELLQGSGYDAPHVRVVATYRFVPLIGNIPELETGFGLNTGYDMQSTIVMRAL